MFTQTPQQCPRRPCRPLPPPLGTVVTVRATGPAPHQVLGLGPLALGGINSSLGHCMEPLSSQVRLFLSHLQCVASWPADWAGSHPDPSPMARHGLARHGMGPPPASALQPSPSLSAGQAPCLSRALGSQLRKLIGQETTDFF